jgi:hypothetical protein
VTSCYLFEESRGLTAAPGAFQATPPGIPEHASLALWGLMAGGAGCYWYLRRRKTPVRLA